MGMAWELGLDLRGEELRISLNISAMRLLARAYWLSPISITDTTCDLIWRAVSVYFKSPSKGGTFQAVVFKFGSSEGGQYTTEKHLVNRIVFHCKLYRGYNSFHLLNCWIDSNNWKRGDCRVHLSNRGWFEPLRVSPTGLSNNINERWQSDMIPVLGKSVTIFWMAKWI